MRGGGVIDEDTKWMINRDNIVDKEDIWGEDEIYIYEWERGGMTVIPPGAWPHLEVPRQTNAEP